MPQVTQTWMVATRRPANERVTIADVAREAGVNKGTVSRALRGVSGVGAATRERILAAAERLEFSASHIATALATGQSRTIGIVLPTLRSWYFSEVASGASEILIPNGFRVELINLDVDSDYLDVDSAQFRRLFRELGVGRGRDALLFAGTITSYGSEIETGGGSGRVPVAASGSPIRQVPGLYIDHRAGGTMAADHLIGLGHHRIALVDGRMPHKTDTRMWFNRSRGFLDTLTSHGLEVATEDHVAPGDCHAEDGERAARTLLDRAAVSHSGLPTAAFCHTDEMAYGLIAELRRNGIRCPDDISVIGFDDHPMSRRLGLTTVSQHAHQQGTKAALALLTALAGDDSPPPPQAPDVTVELVVRDSTAAPRPLPTPRALNPIP